MRFSRARVMRLPVIYVILTVLTVVPLEIAYPIALSSLAAIPLGYALGYLFGQKVEFFNSNGVLYFKRSPLILLIWLVSFIVRIVLEFEFSLNLQALFIVDIILALTAGLLIGEAVHVLRSHQNYTQKKTDTEEAQEQGYLKEM